MTSDGSTGHSPKTAPRYQPIRDYALIGDCHGAAFVADYVVLGGGHARKLTPLPEGIRLDDNALAFLDGRRLWKERGA